MRKTVRRSRLTSSVHSAHRGDDAFLGVEVEGGKVSSSSKGRSEADNVGEATKKENKKKDEEEEDKEEQG